MNRIKIITVFIVAIILLSASVVVWNSSYNQNLSNQETFYVGVTYCGDSVSEAKQLIDKVKNYTNLFVIQSGSLQREPDKLNEICDYAVDSDLSFIIYFGSQHWNYRNNWLQTFDERWADKFLGVYFGDELAGKMLDGDVSFWDSSTNGEIKKMANGSVSCYLPDKSVVTFQSNGDLLVTTHDFYEEGNSTFLNIIFATFYPNGTISAKIQERNNPPIPMDNYTTTYSYEELLSNRPFQTCDETTDMFVDCHNSNLERGMYLNIDFTTFTSDYALYWFDYLCGYDVILTQVGWNHTLEHDIALVRGAANLQNKEWGAIITWKYNNLPYLDTGEAILNQLTTAYTTGAKYGIIFNYAQNMTGPYGTLQEEHFVALEQFWNDVLQNPELKQGSISSEAVLVLPNNYAWGMRKPEDTIWGLWEADEQSEQIWAWRNYLLQEYGLNLDIVYEDPEFPVEEKYDTVFYWNQTL
ncbi:MAG: hypothetical protein CW691_05010 [Candidatus Bathyarchaeum sp.]|nr:MAG: hypothetical protein CW691_05010 [Candidatus Bathyarchaeum sp.]